MVSIELSNEIVALKAGACSFDDIVKATRVSKPTIIKICHERQKDIEDIKQKSWGLERDANGIDVITKHKNITNTLLSRAYDELLIRDMGKMTTRELVGVIQSLQKGLVNMETTLKPLPTNDFKNLSIDDQIKLAKALTPLEIQPTA